MKKTLVESGVKRGAASGPSVRAISDPSASCFSQMRAMPSRLEVNAQRRPSDESAGLPSRPEDVTYFRRGGGGGGGAVGRPMTVPRTTRTAPPAARGIQPDRRLPAGVSPDDFRIHVGRRSGSPFRLRTG